jgi:hypothetical protein
MSSILFAQDKWGMYAWIFTTSTLCPVQRINQQQKADLNVI